MMSIGLRSCTCVNIAHWCVLMGKSMLVMMLVLGRNDDTQAEALPALRIWPTVPFIRGQDLCTYQDAYGRSGAEVQAAMSRELRLMLQLGADPVQAMQALSTMDDLTARLRHRATNGMGMDVLLEGTFKASLDQLYRQNQPKQRNVGFFNAGALQDQVRELREQKRQGYLDVRQLNDLNAIAWGTYAYAPQCKGELVVTLHIQTTCGETFNYQSRGQPAAVMQGIASQVFTQFQSTRFPSRVKIGNRVLELVGAPGAPIGRAASTEMAQAACASIQARLPTVEEYQYLEALGNWNGGVCISRGIWALADRKIISLELMRPSPVRNADEIHTDEIQYYCVR